MIVRLFFALLASLPLGTAARGEVPSSNQYFPPKTHAEAICRQRLLPIHPVDREIDPDSKEQLTIRSICLKTPPPDAKRQACIERRMLSDDFFFIDPYNAYWFCDPKPYPLRDCFDQARRKHPGYTSDFIYKACEKTDTAWRDCLLAKGQWHACHPLNPNATDIPPRVPLPRPSLSGAEALGGRGSLPFITGMGPTRRIGASDIEALLADHQRIGDCQVTVSEFKTADPKLRGFEVSLKDLDKKRVLAIRFDPTADASLDAPYIELQGMDESDPAVHDGLVHVEEPPPSTVILTMRFHPGTHLAYRVRISNANTSIDCREPEPTAYQQKYGLPPVQPPSQGAGTAR